MPRKFDPAAQKNANLANIKREIIRYSKERDPGYPYKYYKNRGLYLINNPDFDLYVATVESKPKRVDYLAASPAIGRRTLILSFKDSLEIREAVELFRADDSENGFRVVLDEEEHPGFVADVYTQVRVKLADFAIDQSL